MGYLNQKIIIIGAGPAGISLAATLKMANINCIILDKNSNIGGALPEIHNELEDLPIGIFKDGIDLTKSLSQFIDNYKIDIKYNCEVYQIDTKEQNLLCTINNSTITYDFDVLIIANGVRFNFDMRFTNTKFKYDIYNRISPCIDDFNNKIVAVIGSGDNATIAALRLADNAKKVYIINRTNTWKSRLDLVDQIRNHDKIIVIENSDLSELNGSSFLESMQIVNIKTLSKTHIKIDKIVFKIGYLPSSEFLPDSISLDENGYIITTDKHKTSVDNIFAIGDITSETYKRIAIAMGQGTELGNYFLKEYLR